MRIPLIAGNWKMNGSLALIEDFGNAFSRTSFLSNAIDIAVIPPFPYLANADEAFEGTPVQIGAQTLYGEASGAFTGAVSAGMLKEFGVHYVLVGHSERRTLFQEDDAAILAQARAAIDAGIVPILCVGETLEERDENRFDDVVLGQLDAVMNGLNEEQRRQLVVAYEPVWAIGTGRTATPEQAQEVHASLRARLRHYDDNLADTMRLLYGGSMKPANAQELLSQADIDGGLIGGASLKPDDFIAICHAAG